MELVRDTLVDTVGWTRTLRVEGPGGRTIRVALAAPASGAAAIGSVIISPGRTEYIEKHAETAGDLTARGFHVLVIDQRGQGLSDRLAADPMAGHLDSYQAAAEHLGLAIAAAAEHLPGPRLLLGHSMGGAIGLEALLTGHAPGVVAAAFSAPMWGLHVPPGAKTLARTMARLGRGEEIAVSTPKVWAPEPFDGNAVTHDPARFARNNALFQMEPRLQIGGPTNGWLAGAFDLFDSFTPQRLGALQTPVLTVSAGAETVVDNASHIRIAGLLPSGVARSVPGAKHELLNERDDLRARFWSHFDSWRASLSLTA
jgi:lysophospholipase